MTPEPGWYPLALAQDVETGTAAGTRLFGRELVVWRDAAGQAHVWEDRCPHRGMRLSFGFVRDGALACLYHGWQFDQAGQCRLIPAHPALAVPATIRATTHDCIERRGMIWTRRTDRLPGMAARSDPDEPGWVPVRSIAIDCAAAPVRDAVADQPPPAAAAVAVQALSPDRTMLHLTLFGAPERSVQLALCDWAEALRHALEVAS